MKDKQKVIEEGILKYCIDSLVKFKSPDKIYFLLNYQKILQKKINDIKRIN